MSVLRRILNFIEHPGFTTPIGVVGGIVGFIFYTPALVICGVWLLWTFHHAGVVRGLPRKKQVLGYVVFVLLMGAGLWGVRLEIQAHLPDLGKQIAKLVIETLPKAQAPQFPPAASTPPQTVAPAQQKPVSIAFLYADHKIEIHNTGSEELKLWGDKLDDAPRKMEGQATMVPLAPYDYHIDAQALENLLRSKWGNDGENWVPFYLYLSTLQGKKFTAKCVLWVVLKSGQFKIETQNHGYRDGWNEF